VWEKGVQFRETRAAVPSDWPAGTYEVELLGWADRRPGRSAANLRTEFRAEVPAFIEREMRRWESASSEQWARASDRAVGFPLIVTDIRAGL
jgi:hypothetical protein